jgi:hypothetical protein
MFLRYLYYVLQQLFAISTMAHFNEEGLWTKFEFRKTPTLS